MSSLEFSAVCKHYGSVRALDGVSMQVCDGEFATILGPSGSGKTTLLSLAAGIIAPTSGRITIGGRDVTWLPASQRQVGLVFQSYALFPHMSVFDNVAFPLSIRRVAKTELNRRVREALRLVQLEELASRRPSQLSGGQQQRVALARALVFNPDVLLLDEPLAALDRKLREEVRLEVRRLQRSLGMTTLLVTHDQDEALSLSDRIMVIHGGRVQQIDTPADAYHRPQNRFVANFLGMANFLEGELQQHGDAYGIRLKRGEVITCLAPPSDAAMQVCGVLRPEQISLGPADAPDTRVQGQVLDVIFFGDSTRYIITLPSGFTLTVQSNGRRSSYPRGANVGLRWEPADVWLLPRLD